MEKPSVTIQHKEAYAAGGLLCVLSLVIGLLNWSANENTFPGVLIPGLGLLLALLFFFFGNCSEKLDENGICICTPFSEKQAAWDQVVCVGILAPSGKDVPKIEFTLKNHSIPYQIQYTKRTLSCVRHYYGEPDWDKYGKPPSNF